MNVEKAGYYPLPQDITPLIAREATGTNNITLDQNLNLLVRSKLISVDTAKAAAAKPADLMRSLRMG